MGTGAYEDNETTNPAAEPHRKPEPVALGTDAEPTAVLLGADVEAPTSMMLGSEAAATSTVLGSDAAPTSVAAAVTASINPARPQAVGAVPWAEPPDEGPTAPLPDPPGEKFPESLSGRQPDTRSDNPAAASGRPVSAPTGFTALGTDIDPGETRVQAQVSPLLVARPRVSMRKRLARRLSVELMLPLNDHRGRWRFYCLVALTAVVTLCLMIGTFKIASWALSSYTSVGKKPGAAQAPSPIAPKKHR